MKRLKFCRRVGNLTVMGKDKLKRFAELKTFPNVIEPITDYSKKKHTAKGTWNQIFKNQNPIILELGCGAGEYTLELAKLFPKINFIGIDIKGARIWKGAKIALDEKLNNVRFLRTKVDYIQQFFEKNEVDEIWLTFSDPQPKKPRKRLTSELFINRYKSIMKPNGIIHLKTDSNLLYEFTKKEIQLKNYELINNIKNIHQYHYKEDNLLKKILTIKTFYEQKWIEMNKIIKYLSFIIKT